MVFWSLQQPKRHDHQRARGPGLARAGPAAAASERTSGSRTSGGGGVLPTVAEVLALQAVRRGQPRVVAGAHRLDTPVRWVHAIEFADAARLLRGGELVLATGIVLPDEGALLDAYVADLASVGVAALAVELGRRYTGGLPAGFVAAAESHGLPLIVFDREVPFVEITEAVHARIIDDQLDQLRV